MLAFEIARKDFIQVLRDRRAVLFLLLMPMVFTLVFSVAMKPSADKDADTRLPVAIIDQDGGALLSQSLEKLLSASDTVQVLPVDDPSAVDELIRGGKLAAAIIVPAGYTQAKLAGESTSLEVVIDNGTEAGQTAARAIQSSFTRLEGAVRMARFSAGAYEKQAGSGFDRGVFLQDAVNRTVAAWQAPRASVTLTGPAIQSGGEESNANNQFSPGMMVMFTVFGLTQTALVLVNERRGGALQRLLASPLRRWELILGHIFGSFTLVFVQQLVLVVFGQLALQVQYFREPVATLLVMAALSLWVSTLGLLIATLAKGEEQVVLYSMVCMFLFSALGGAWFPLEMVGKTFAAVGHITPTAWAMDGFQNVLMRNLGVQSVLLPVGILLGYALACFGLSLWKFKFE